MSKHQSFETERLILKPTSIEDAEMVFKIMNMPKFKENIGDRNITSIEKAEEYIKNKYVTQFAEVGYGSYTVIRKKDNVKVGSCGLHNREGVDGVDIGFAFFTEYEGKGYAFEAAKKVKEIAFDVFNLPKISGITIKENIGSQKLLSKLGLEFKRITHIPNDDADLLLYELENNQKY